MSIERVAGGRWWRIFWIASLAPARARVVYKRKYLPQPATRHPCQRSLSAPNESFQGLKMQAGSRNAGGLI
jgi:hypothetical protein